MLGLVVFGSRTWMCTIAAPALAASIAEVAICSGVTGTAGLRPGVSAEPVTAHEIITLRCMVAPMLIVDDLLNYAGFCPTAKIAFVSRWPILFAFSQLTLSVFMRAATSGPICSMAQRNPEPSAMIHQ